MLPQRGPVTVTQKAQVTLYVTLDVTTVFAQVSKQQDVVERKALTLATGKTPCCGAGKLSEKGEGGKNCFLHLRLLLSLHLV